MNASVNDSVLMPVVATGTGSASQANLPVLHWHCQCAVTVRVCLVSQPERTNSKAGHCQWVSLI